MTSVHTRAPSHHQEHFLQNIPAGSAVKKTKTTMLYKNRGEIIHLNIYF